MRYVQTKNEIFCNFKCLVKVIYTRINMYEKKNRKGKNTLIKGVTSRLRYTHTKSSDTFFLFLSFDMFMLKFILVRVNDIYERINI